MKKTDRKSSTRMMALCAVLSALGVVLLYLGSFIEVLDLSVAAAAKYEVYCDYNRKSFSSANSERYREAFELYSARFRMKMNSSKMEEKP